MITIAWYWIPLLVMGGVVAAYICNLFVAVHDNDDRNGIKFTFGRMILFATIGWVASPIFLIIMLIATLYRGAREIRQQLQ